MVKRKEKGDMVCEKWKVRGGGGGKRELGVGKKQPQNRFSEFQFLV